MQDSRRASSRNAEKQASRLRLYFQPGSGKPEKKTHGLSEHQSKPRLARYDIPAVREVTMPFDAEPAHAMIRDIRAHPVLTGRRDKPALAIDALAAALSRVSLLIVDLIDRISEIDVNPLFVSADGVTAVDAFVVLRE
jgi:hypothetical protein